MRKRYWLAAAVASLAATPLEAAELKIGVVNVREILSRYRKAEDILKREAEKYKGRREGIERRREALARRVSEYRADMAGEQDPAMLREAKEIETEEFLLKLDYRELQRQIQLSRDRATREVLDDVVAACQRIGRAEGYDLILKLYGPDPEAGDDRAKVEAHQLDALLFVAESVDITSEVLEFLENAYRRGLKLVPEEKREAPVGGHG